MEKFTLEELKVIHVAIIEMYQKIKDVNPNDKRLKGFEVINQKINDVKIKKGYEEYVFLV